MLMISKRTQGILALASVTMLWGISFPIVKNAVLDMPVFLFNAIRFDIAALTILLFILVRHRGLKLLSQCAKWRKDGSILRGTALGFILYLGYTLQTFGLQMTSATNSAFLTGLCVIFVPLIGPFFGQKLKAKIVVGVAVAGVGLWFLTGGAVTKLNYGDFLTILCAIAYALHILFIAISGNHHDALAITCIQMATVAILSHLSNFYFETTDAWPQSFSSWSYLVFTGVFVSAIPFLVQIYAQRIVPAVTAALVFATEPLWGAAAAYVINHEILSLSAYWGGLLTVIGILIVEAPPIPKILRPKIRAQ